MSEYYLNNQMFRDASIILSNINFDSTSYSITNEERCDIYIKCAECCLEDDEAVEAEVFVNRVSSIINGLMENRLLQLRYRTTAARVLDSNRKFLEASKRYYDLSNTTDEGVRVLSNNLPTQNN